MTKLENRGRGGKWGVVLPLALTVAAVLCSFSAAGSTTVRPGQHVVQGDYKIGAFAVKADATLFGALEAFGKPTTLKRAPYNTCAVKWLSLGVSITFYNLGGHDACKPQYGFFGTARVTGRNWRTGSGLAIGDPERWVWRYHRKARLHLASQPYWPQGYWLVTRGSVYGDGSSYPGLLAIVRDGKVAEFRIRYQGGGE